VLFTSALDFHSYFCHNVFLTIWKSKRNRYFTLILTVGGM